MEIKRKKIRNENRKKKENIGNKENTKDQEIKLKKKKNPRNEQNIIHTPNIQNVNRMIKGNLCLTVTLQMVKSNLYYLT